MSKQDVIAQANRLLTQLPDNKAAEVVALLTRILSEAGEDADLQAHYTATYISSSKRNCLVI